LKGSISPTKLDSPVSFYSPSEARSSPGGGGQNGTRVALVLSNREYGGHYPDLKEGKREVAEVAEALRGLGWSVLEVRVRFRFRVRVRVRIGMERP